MCDAWIYYVVVGMVCCGSVCISPRRLVLCCNVRCEIRKLSNVPPPSQLSARVKATVTFLLLVLGHVRHGTQMWSISSGILRRLNSPTLLSQDVWYPTVCHRYLATFKSCHQIKNEIDQQHPVMQLIQLCKCIRRKHACVSEVKDVWFVKRHMYWYTGVILVTLRTLVDMQWMSSLLWFNTTFAPKVCESWNSSKGWLRCAFSEQNSCLPAAVLHSNTSRATQACSKYAWMFLTRSIPSKVNSKVTDHKWVIIESARRFFVDLPHCCCGDDIFLWNLPNVNLVHIDLKKKKKTTDMVQSLQNNNSNR